jgi:hypothetical protein
MSFDPARRSALHSMIHGGLALAASAAVAAPPAGDGRDVPPGAPKFHADGTVAYWPGNTIICHIDRHSAAFAALLDAHVALMRSGVTHRLAVLPPASYHMTVFEGIAYAQRHQYYPAGLAPDADLAACNAWMLDKLRDFDLGCALPLRMRPSPLEGQTNRSAILLEPADDGERAKLRGLRDRLAAHLRLRAPNHDSYRFHISLNYVTSPLSETEETQFARVRAALLADVIARAPLIELGRPELTFFDDMFAFRPQLYLDNRAPLSGKNTA